VYTGGRFASGELTKRLFPHTNVPGMNSPRIYALWRRSDIDREDVRVAISKSCSAEEHELIDRSGAATVSIAFKQLLGCVLGHHTATRSVDRDDRECIANVLSEHGMDPALERGKRTSWSTFLKAHWDRADPTAAAITKFERVCGETRTLSDDGVYRADGLLQQIIA
jgi:hypothetical protein